MCEKLENEFSSCEECIFFHWNNPDYPDGCEYVDCPPCNEE